MFITKKSLNRRTFLRAAGATLALPMLDSMTPAFGAPGKRVPRMSFLYIPNGVNPNKFFPDAAQKEAKEFTLASSLSPLEPYKKQVISFYNMAHHCADRQNDGAGDHSRATGAFLSGCHAKRTQGADLENGITADQIAAQTLGKDSLLPSLELSLEDRNIAPLWRRRIHLRVQQHTFVELAHHSIADGKRSATRLRTSVWRRGKPADRANRIREDRSILDSVTGFMAKLQSDLGASDKRKVDQYFSSIREVEQRLQRIEKQKCGIAGGGDRDRPSAGCA